MEETHKEETLKQGAGRLGGLARARNAAKKQKAMQQANEKHNNKRNNALLDVSDSAGELDEVGGPRKRRSMLEETPSEQTPPRMEIPKLNVSGSPSKNTFFPHIVTGNEYPLPITIQTDNNKIYRIKHAANPTHGEISFWQMLQQMPADVRESVGLEAFGASIDQANKDLHLDMAAHIFPQLLTITGQPRYTKANPSELIVAKKNYREFLTAIRDNTTRLLGSVKEDLAEMNAPLSMSTFTRDLLGIVPRQPPTILEHEHRIQIDNHQTMLAHTAEIVGQELTGLGTIASNSAEEARKASITLTTIYAWLRRLLGDDNTTDTAGLSELKQESGLESEDEDDRFDIFEKGPSTNPTAAITPSRTGRINFFASSTGPTAAITPNSTGMINPISSSTGPTTIVPSGTGTITPTAPSNSTGTINLTALSSSTGTINLTALSSSTGTINPTAPSSSTGKINPTAPSSSTGTINPPARVISSSTGTRLLPVNSPSTMIYDRVIPARCVLLL